MSVGERGRTLWRRLIDAVAPAAPDAPDPFQRLGEPLEAEPDVLSDLLREIETAALAVYAQHGLPTLHGHYRLSPQSEHWTFIAENLTPAERFEQAAQGGAEPGSRFGKLADIGRGSDTPALERASALLEGVALARRLRAAGWPASDLVSVIRLGETWRDLG